MTINNDKAIKQIYNYIVANHKTIKVHPGKLRFNFRCSYNAVHFAKKKKDKRIAMCVYMDNGEPIIHFLNYHNKKFKDHTLGQWSRCYNYYFIRWIDEEDFWDVNVIFDAFRADLANKLSWWTRLTSDYRG